VLTDVSVRFEGLVARDVTSQGVPDVMAARPIVVLGRYDGPGAGAVVVSGRNGHGPWSRRIEFAAHEPSATHAPIRHLFARKWVEMLEDRLAVAPEDEGLRGAIRGLGLRYRLLTPFTSFVATDHAVVNRTGAVDSVRQPVPMPHGVSNQAVAGGASRPRGGRTSDLDSLMGSALGERNRPAGPARGAVQAAPPVARPQARTASAAPSPGRAPAVAPETPAPAVPSEARPPAEVPASLPPESVRRVIRAHQTEVQRCYERGVPAQQRRGGRLTVTLVISPAGVVQSAIAAGLGNAQVEQCVVAAVRRWRFPAGAGPTRITYPLVLRAP
jgi:Ca-activated chloride channel family protein